MRGAIARIKLSQLGGVRTRTAKIGKRSGLTTRPSGLFDKKENFLITFEENFSQGVQDVRGGGAARVQQADAWLLRQGPPQELPPHRPPLAAHPRVGFRLNSIFSS